MKRFLAAVTAAAVLAGCTAPSQPILDQAVRGCSIGKQWLCDQIPQLQAVVAAEQQQQANQAAAALAVGLGAAAIGYAASRPAYYYAPVVVVPCRWGCW
jgi:hypothetical protein